MKYYLIIIITLFDLILCNFLPYNFKSCLSLSERANWSRSIFENNDPIIIESTRRSSHKIVSYIIAILLKERLGYNVIINEMKWDNVTETINRLACAQRNCNYGKPKSHINMEVVMPPGFTSSKWINQNLIFDCGPLGPIAKTGIYFYNKGISDLPALDDWRNFLENVHKNDQFSNPNIPIFRQLRILGNCNKSTSELCRTQFSIDPDLPHYHARVIDSIYKTWKVENVISHAISKYYFTWYPNEMTIQRKFSRVLFPDCYQLSSSVSDKYCDDSVNQLAKVIWIEIKSKAPLIYSLINSFQLTQQNIRDFLLKVNLTALNIEEEYFKIACDWIKDNNILWEPPTIGWNSTKYLSIIVLLPNSKFNISDKENEALEYALKYLNNHANFFGTFQYQLVLKYNYIACNESEMFHDYLKSVNIEKDGYGNTIIGILSGLPTDCMDDIYKITNAQRKIMISFRHEIFPILLRYRNNPILKKYMNVPFILQTMPSKETYYALLLKLSKHIGWLNYIIITDNDDHKSGGNSSFISKRKIYKTYVFDEKHFEQYLRKNKINSKIFMVDYSEVNIWKLLCFAGKSEMTLENGYVWIINRWFGNKLIPESLTNCSQHIQLINNNYFYLSPYNEEAVTCSDFYSDNLYRAMLFLGQSVSFTLLNNPGLNDFNADILINNIIKVESNLYYCSKKMITHIPVKMDHNALFWKKWYFYKINGTNATTLFEFEVKEKIEIIDSLEIVVRSLRHWDAPKDILVEYCWAGFLVELLNMKCINAQILFLLVLSLIILLTFIIMFLVIYYMKAKETYNPMKKCFQDLVQDLLDIDIHSSKLILNHIIGRGAFGMVYGGEACNSKGVLEAVAVKTISENSDWIEKIDFFTEAKVMRKLRHPNIVELIGVCLENENNVIFLIMELMVEGDLRNYLLSRRSNAAMYCENSTESINLRNRLNNFAKEIAEGLYYMHSKFMVHRDVACRNCLISHDFRVKLGDFGLTRYLSPPSINGYYKFQGNLSLPVRWMPPEGIQNGLFSIKSDIWSFGILLFEIVTFGVCPYQDFSTGRNIELMDLIKRNQLSIVTYLPHSARDSVVHDLIKHCCSYDPRNRPESMEQIINILKSHTTCIRPYLTKDPPKFEGDKNLENLSIDLPGIVICEDEVPFTSPCEMQLSSSQRYINMINKAFGIKSFSVKEKTDFPVRRLRPCQSSISISKNQLSAECVSSFSLKKSIELFAGSIPADLCDKMSNTKKSRSFTRSISNLFKISQKQSNNKIKILNKDF